MKKKVYILIFLFLIFLIVIAVAVFLIVAINKPDQPTSITSHTISATENKTNDICWMLENGKVVCFVGSIEISTGETIEESFNVSLNNPKN